MASDSNGGSKVLEESNRHKRYREKYNLTNPKMKRTIGGYEIARTPHLNKGHSFSAEERDAFGVRGLYPCGQPFTLDEKVNVALTQLRLKSSPLEKYIFLHTIQDSDETLFYALLLRHTAETMPLVYTPTVGEACQKWGQIYRHTPRGLYLSINDKGQIRRILDNYPNKDIKAIVITDGERILGLGDQGVNGMGIPVGKLALYTACAGLHPSQCLPVQMDVGTDRESFWTDPTYMGLRHSRVRGAPFNEIIAEFFEAAQDAYGRTVLIQFEDFGNTTAFELLEHHQPTACCFNDDIQGTASVVLAGIISSLKLADKSKVHEHTFLFYGAGEAGVGIANMIAQYVSSEVGITEVEARSKIWLVDSKGLVSSARTDHLQHHKLPYAHAPPTPVAGPAGAETSHLLDAIRSIRPTALIGVSAQGQTFTETVCKEMAALNAHPLIFALSNPTSKSECTAQQAYEWTDGKCVFASGSPFDPVTLADGRHFVPGQGNNSYIFPGVGLGTVAASALQLTDEDLIVAAATLASLVDEDMLSQGCAYPPLSDIRRVSLAIATAVCENIVKRGRSLPEVAAQLTSKESILARCQSLVYVPSY